MEISKSFAKNAHLACAFLLGSDRNRYGKLIEDLENDYSQGQDRYPKTITAAYNLLVHWKQNPQNRIRALGTSVTSGVAFTNMGDEDETTLTNVGGNKRDKSSITSYNCNEKGHHSNRCTRPNRREIVGDQSGTQMLMSGAEECEQSDFQFHQLSSETAISTTSSGHLHHQGDKLPQDWVLLDNQSTVDVFCNYILLRNMHNTSGTCTIPQEQ